MPARAGSQPDTLQTASAVILRLFSRRGFYRHESSSRLTIRFSGLLVPERSNAEDKSESGEGQNGSGRFRDTGLNESNENRVAVGAAIARSGRETER